HVDEFAELATQVAPAALHVLDQRLSLVLREQADLADAAVHAVGQHEIDDAEFAAKGRGRLAAMFGEAAQPFTASARHDHRQCAAREPADVAARCCSRCIDHCTLYLPQPDYIHGPAC